MKVTKLNELTIIVDKYNVTKQPKFQDFKFTNVQISSTGLVNMHKISPSVV